MEAKGIYFRTNGRSEIITGIDREKFIAFLQSLPTNAKGFIQLKIIPHKNPNKFNYSHRGIIEPPKEAATPE